MSKRQNQFQMSVWDYINRLKRKEMWSLCNQFPNFKDEFQDVNYRVITNDVLKNFLRNEYYNGDLSEYLN